MLRKSCSAGAPDSLGIVKEGGSRAGFGAGRPPGFLIAGSGNGADGDGTWGEGSGFCSEGDEFFSCAGAVCRLGLCSGLDVADFAGGGGDVEARCGTAAWRVGADHAHCTAPGNARVVASRNLTSLLSGRALRPERNTPSRLLAPPRPRNQQDTPSRPDTKQKRDVARFTGQYDGPATAPESTDGSLVFFVRQLPPMLCQG
jgi:hypothetical protein